MLSEMLCADDFVFIGETTYRFGNKFVKQVEVSESKGLKINLVKTKMMVSVSHQRIASLKVMFSHVGSVA